MSVTFYKDGEPVAREQILELEVRRARRMMALLFSKLGSDGMEKLFANEIVQADELERSWCKQSDSGFTPSVAVARVDVGNGGEFVKWFVDGYLGPNATAMMRAHPEHLGAKRCADGRVGIVEVPGHTELPAILYLRQLESWPEDVQIELDPDMPIRMMGRSEGLDGEVHGYLLHQFRDTSPGFEAKLAIYWRDGAPEELVKGHSDHLILEFNNWLQAYAQSRSQPAELMPLMLAVNT